MFNSDVLTRLTSYSNIDYIDKLEYDSCYNLNGLFLYWLLEMITVLDDIEIRNCFQIYASKAEQESLPHINVMCQLYIYMILE
jgi:hypothetical protein